MFVASVGSVTGRDHRRACRDGQDGYAVVALPNVTAAIVTDGCSSGRTSEVGARLGAAWIADLIARSFCPQKSDRDLDLEQAARDVTTGLTTHLEEVARSLSKDGVHGAHGAIDPNVVGEMLLFGFLAAVATEKGAIVFGVGDGMAWIDGVATVIDPGPENAPMYPAYALLGATIEPRVHHLGDNADTIVVATDGVEELLKTGGSDAFETLVRDDRLLANPSLLRKRLIVLSDRGLFWDDATIGIVRRVG
jgi:hypothetical protein